MAEFQFDPPVMLRSNVAVTTFNEAAAFMRSFHGARRPSLHDLAAHSRIEQGYPATAGALVAIWAR
jgi:hypothetical protein